MLAASEAASPHRSSTRRKTGGELSRRDRSPGRRGLLEKLIDAVRPEFRGEVILVAPEDPVFGGLPCQVDGCTRTARVRESASGTTIGGSTKDARCQSRTSSRRQTLTFAGTGSRSPATSLDAVTAAEDQDFAPSTTLPGCRSASRSHFRW